MGENVLAMTKIKRGSGEFETTIVDVHGNEIDIVVGYKGYSDPGKLYGPPEDCYPPEGEIEITYITGVDEKDIPDSELKDLETFAYNHLSYGDFE